MSQRSEGIYFGWYIVGAAAIITLLTVGLRLGIGPFMMPVMDDLEMSRTELSTIVAVSMIVYGLGMPVAGWLSNRYSTRFVLLLGVVIVVASIFWTILANGPFSFLFSFGIFLSLGLSFTSPVSMTPLVSRWFNRRRGKAFFYLSTGSMAGIAVMTPLEMMSIEWVGWHYTLILFAILFTLIVVPTSIFIMREDVPDGADGGTPEKTRDTKSFTRPKQVELTWRDAVKTRSYWQIVFGLFACGFSMNLLGSHGVPMLMDHHFGATTASFGIGLIGIVAIFSTMALGSIADKYPRKNILFCIYTIRGLGFLGLVYAATPWQLYLISATGGLVWAGAIAMGSAILADLYGVRLLGTLYGWAYFGHQIGGAIGSFLGGWGYEKFGTHVFAFGLTTLLLISAGWVSYRLPTKQSMPSKPLDTTSLKAKA